MVEVNAENGQLFDKPNIIVRGFALPEAQGISNELAKQLKNALSQKKRPVTDWIYMRKFVGEVSEKYIFKNFRKRPLILPVIIEV